MASIQEALRELKKQRVNESKTRKSLNEDTNSLKKIIRLINRKINDGGLSPEEVQKCVQDKDYMYALLYVLSKESQEADTTVYLVMEHNDTGDTTYFGVDGVVNEDILDDQTKITISTFYDANDHEPDAHDYTLSQAQNVLEECSGDDFDYTYLDYIDNEEDLDESLSDVNTETTTNIIRNINYHNGDKLFDAVWDALSPDYKLISYGHGGEGWGDLYSDVDDYDAAIYWILPEAEYNDLIELNNITTQDELYDYLESEEFESEDETNFCAELTKDGKVLLFAGYNMLDGSDDYCYNDVYEDNKYVGDAKPIVFSSIDDFINTFIKKRVLNETLFGLGDAVRASMAIKDGKSKRQYLKDRQKEDDVFKNTPGKKHLRNMYNFANGKPPFNKKDEELNEAVLGDEDGDIEVLSFNLPEGKTCENGKCAELNEAALGDEDGDIEVLSFNLPESVNESVITEAKDDKSREDEEALTVENVKKDKTLAKLSNKIIKKLIEDSDANTMDEFIDWYGGYDNLTEWAFDLGTKLKASEFWEMVEGDKKFEDVVTKICQKIKWIDKDGKFVDLHDAPKPSIRKLTLDFIRLAGDKQSKEEAFQILKDAYTKNNYRGLPVLDVEKLVKSVN